MANTFLNIIVTVRDAAAAQLDRLKSAAGGVLDKVLSLKGALLGLATGAVAHALMGLVKAFGDQEEAVIKLNAALSATGRFSTEGSTAVQDMARELQHMTTVGDEALIGASATIAQFTKTLSTDQLAQVQRAVVGIAQVAHRDVGTVSLQVAKGLAGIGVGLKKMGVDLTGARTEQERFNIIMQKTAGWFDVAVVASDSLNGRLEQAHHAWNDLKETLGQVLANVVGLQGPNNDLRDGIVKIDDAIRNNIGSWVKWGKVVLDVAKVIIVSLASAFKLAWNIGKGIGSAIVIGTSTAGVAIANIINKVVIGQLNSLLQKVDDFLGLFGQHLKFRIGEISTASDQDQITIALEQYHEAADGVDDALKAVRDAWNQLIGDVKKNPLPPSAFAVTKGAGGAAAPPGEDGAGAEALKARVKALGDELGNLSPLFEKGIIPLNDYVARLDAAAKEFDALVAAGAIAGTAIDDFRLKLAGAHAGLAEIGRAPDTGEDSVLTFWEKVTEQLTKATENAHAFDQVVAGITLQLAEDFGGAISAAFAALTSGSESAGEAFKKAMLGAVAAVANALGKTFIAQALASFASITAPPPIGPNPGGAAAGAKYLAAAAAMFAVAGLASGAASGGGKGGGGGGGGGAGRAPQGAAASQGEATIIVQGGLINTADPDQMDQLAHAIEQLSDKRVTIKQGG